MDQRTDIACYRVACTRLKVKIVDLPNFVSHDALNVNAKAFYLLSSAVSIEDASQALALPEQSRDSHAT